jgi:hypothetical protein
MHKTRSKVLLLFLLFIIPYLEPAFSQENKDEKLLVENPMKKGSCAVVFELGTLLGDSSNFEGYNFLFKYHFSDNAALRIDVGFSENKQNESFYDTYDYKKYGFRGGITYQLFITRKYFARPFISAGPYFYQSYDKTSYTTGKYWKNNSWELGIALTIGAEAFVYKSIGIVGEYILRGYYGEKTYESYCPSCRITYEHIESDAYKFRANTCRLGVSFYF